MSEPDFFFINHTRKEYCAFDNNESIIHSIELAVYKNLKWEITDDIRVDTQSLEKNELFNYLDGEGYKNLDWEDEGGPANEESSDESDDEHPHVTDMMEE